MVKPIENIHDLAEVAGAELGISKSKPKIEQKSNQNKPNKQQQHSKPQVQKPKKGKGRVYNGNTTPDLIEKAIKALTPAYPYGVDDNGNEIWEEPCLPTSVELKDEYALVWFEYDPDYDEGYDYKFEYNHAVPLYYFWGKKKREKYLKKQREESTIRLESLNKRLKELGIRDSTKKEDE